jgi:hypothetical protein
MPTPSFPVTVTSRPTDTAATFTRFPAATLTWFLAIRFVRPRAEGSKLKNDRGDRRTNLLHQIKTLAPWTLRMAYVSGKNDCYSGINRTSWGWLAVVIPGTKADLYFSGDEEHV